MDKFLEKPILNSPYECPSRHWELDASGQPTHNIVAQRRRVSFLTPIPIPRRINQARLVFDPQAGALDGGGQQYELAEVMNGIRRHVDAWRAEPDPDRWRVTPETARLLRHWRSHSFSGVRPFFCQVEAVETAIWLTEVAPRLGRKERNILDHLSAANEQANPGLARMALKLATGAGKTMVMKNIMTLNDEAHHCYRSKPPDEDEEGALQGDERQEARNNKEAARVWISGLSAVQERLGVRSVIDLSATPFFLRGSGYAEGTLFPWTVSDFSLMDAIESGIVKLPRVPIADNVPAADMPKFRNLWAHIGKQMPKKGRGKAVALDPLSLPVELQTALDALYGHYEKIFDLWAEAGIEVPPCFIVVCNNTATSKLVYDYISGFERAAAEGAATLEQGRLELFRNFDEDGTPLARPRTLLIDSQQLDSPEPLDGNFRAAARDEIERFRWEIVARTGDRRQAEALSDQDLLREVMNTVGKVGRLGGDTRCVVSVSMLTEGWDANTVTHVLGVRAFGTQLLCEQVVGRALRRQSYDLNEEGVFDTEYADVFGIPFDFTAKPVTAKPVPPRETVQVHAVTPERDACEIRFPRVQGYRVELPNEKLSAVFNADSTLELTPDLVGPTITRNEGIIGEGVDLNLKTLDEVRSSTVVYSLTRRLLETKWRDAGEAPKWHLFGQLKRIARQWLESHLVCKGNTFAAQLMYQELADMVCERISKGIVARYEGERPVKAVLDPYNPVGSTRRCHVNWAVCDSEWESEFCRAAESQPRVRAYVKNQGLGLEVPYRYGSKARTYLPDFIALVDDGRGEDDLLRLIVEIKGYRREDAKEKKSTMQTYWLPAANGLGAYGRWSFAEFTDAHEIQNQFDATIAAASVALEG